VLTFLERKAAADAAEAPADPSPPPASAGDEDFDPDLPF
jgi:hypothetical protein